MSRISIRVKSILKCTKLGTILRKSMWNKRLVNEASICKTIDKYMGKISQEEKEKIKKDILDMAKNIVSVQKNTFVTILKTSLKKKEKHLFLT